MASINFFSSLLVLLFLPYNNTCADQLLKTCNFEAIYQLGDSIADTGNLIRENLLTPFARLPYGQTLKKATGRCSDGLLMIDFIAQSAGIPLLEPYLKNENSIFDHGVNFAVAGATALPTAVLAKKLILSPLTWTSLSKQLEWMQHHFNQICKNTQDCSKKISNSLFMVGEIGGNDINFALLGEQSIDIVKKMVPEIVQFIKDAVKKVIGYGAIRIVIPGNFPIGCLPIYLTQFQTKNNAAYDDFHCLKELNDLAIYYNDLLQGAIEDLENEHTNVTIAYGDYYNAYMWVLRNSSSMGFDQATLLQKSCCGIGGDYNFNILNVCGLPSVPVCSNPDTYLSWDGIHSTQKTYSYMAEWLLREMNLKFKCNA